MANYAPSSSGLLASLQPWLEDSQVAEILLNKPQEIFVEKAGSLVRHEVTELDARTLDMLFQLVANENQQEISIAKPLLSASLLDGSRVQLVLPPTALYHTLSIRRKVVKDFTLADYRKMHFYNTAKGFDIKAESIDLLPDADKELIKLYKQAAWDEFIKKAIAARKNIVISGGTSSGKTTFLNACLREVSLDDRIIILEDTREVDIPHNNKVQLLASKGDQGVSRVNMQDLVQCCLRLRPDRIICGEIRGKEIIDFVSACSTGHEGSITSIHANNPRIAFMRMAQMYKLNNVPSMSDADILHELQEVIDIVIQIGKAKEGRKVQSVYYKYGSLAHE